jgi:hypothetical protein
MAQRVRPSHPSFYPVTHPTSSGTSNSNIHTSSTMNQQHYMSYHSSSMNHHHLPPQEQQLRPAAASAAASSSSSSSSGLIRLTLRKPMGIVFEPMPTQAGLKGTGVRICELPRTGAAALSGKLELGDELLSINGVTMSRLTFDEIMEFIIAADPEGLHLLFRRQRKTKGSAATATGTASFPTASSLQQQQNSVKWAKQESEIYDPPKSTKSSSTTKSKDHHHHHQQQQQHQTRHIHPNRSKSSSREDDEDSDNDDEMDEDDDTNTYQSEEPSIQEYTKKKVRPKKKEKESTDKRSSSSRAPYTSSSSRKERASTTTTASSRRNKQHQHNSSRHRIKKKKDELGFLDMLIDSFCQVTNGGKLAGRRDDDSMYTEDDISEDGTYHTNDDPSLVSEDYRLVASNKKKKELEKKKKRNSTKDNKSRQHRERSGRKIEEESVDEEQTVEEEETIDEGGTAEDDYTLETMDTNERAAQKKIAARRSVEDGTSEYSEDPDASIGWAPLKRNESKASSSKDQHSIEKKVSTRDPVPTQPNYNTNNSSKKHLIYEPTLENRQSTSFDANIQLPFRELEYNYDADEGDVSVLTNNMSQYGSHISPQALVYVPSYVPEPGKTLQECIESNPERFYRHAVKEILSHNEPEKVRLLDKLMAKYQGREEHLIQKLTLRYKTSKQQQQDESNETSHWGKTTTIPEEGESTQQSPTEVETDEREEPWAAKQTTSTNNMNYESLGSFGTIEDMKSPLSISSAILEREKSPVKQETPPRAAPQEVAKVEPKVPLFDSPPPAPPARKAPPELVLPNSFSSEKVVNTQEVRNTGVAGKASAVIPKSSPHEGLFNPPPPPSPPHTQVPKENTTTTPMDAFNTEDDFSQDEGESEYTSEDYSDSQIDGTSPAVIAQVSELLNFVYGKTSVPGQIDRVSTIMRAYEGRENVLLELLETKALIKANQMNEHPPAGLIPSANTESPSASHDEAYDDYDEHQDDISSVSGDNSTKFNVKVPLASEHVSPIVSPITPSVGNTVSLNPFRKLSFFVSICFSLCFEYLSLSNVSYRVLAFC